MCFSERRIRELEDLQTNTCHAEIDSVSHREYFTFVYLAIFQFNREQEYSRNPVLNKSIIPG